ncbi:cGMP-specific 3',5'-cGMP phosphodiesterase 3 [Parelaphostrongylus tenuis]|uniref:cGMP-specific 3',5'-cGMP phosphodiesterase 3 n=1 Tax=Parelaphostrongylus tenuis TaxID=148309 RepID=A0AAD5R8Y1_PARTN|nr:cGMP-specific 3',5'-cGMP phosphodiesterase 3 [Parelaphostrongylus tenuis]
MAMVSDWSLPIFEIAEKHENTLLSRITYTVFKQADLFRIFKLSPIKFFNFFHALERGYWDIPYHNRVHAADVLHGCYYLTCHPVRPLIGASSTPDSPLPPTLTKAAPISCSMSTLELMALYTAAAMHDYDHPGRTNAFLVAAEDKKAILYNDRSVLENHHAAESWRLLQQTENNFIETLDSAETKRFRYLVLEYILATDLKQHFEIIMTFNEKSSEMELMNESDRVLMAKMVIKMADINSPTKPYTLHRQWTDRICEEFYEQGDEERRRGMPITPYMDRSDAQVAKLQDSFIAHVVSPLAVALNEAGLLPILPGLVEPEMMINLKHNHQKWLQEIDRNAGETAPILGNGVIEEESSSSESPDNHKSTPLLELVVEDHFDMCTIRENDEEEYL